MGKSMNLSFSTAAFRRLCVETGFWLHWGLLLLQPPSGGCVLKPEGCGIHNLHEWQPPSGGCVLKQDAWQAWQARATSRLQAAVC